MKIASRDDSGLLVQMPVLAKSRRMELGSRGIGQGVCEPDAGWYLFTVCGISGRL